MQEMEIDHLEVLKAQEFYPQGSMCFSHVALEIRPGLLAGHRGLKQTLVVEPLVTTHRVCLKM